MTLEISRRQDLVLSPEKIKLLKDTVCKGASDAELEMFLHICKHTGLDPFMKQIYSIPRGGQRTTQTSIDGFRLIAERTGKYAPGKESIFTYDDKGQLESATSWVRKMTNDGTWHDVGATVYMCEFRGSTPFWTKMPRVMLSKVAEAVALRKAFPVDLSGIYTADEMDQAEIVQLEPTVDIDALEIALLAKVDQNKIYTFTNFLKVAREHFKKTKKNKWPEDWIAILERYDADLVKFDSDVETWNDKQLAKRALERKEEVIS